MEQGTVPVQAVILNSIVPAGNPGQPRTGPYPAFKSGKRIPSPTYAKELGSYLSLGLSSVILQIKVNENANLQYER